ncbi:MAG: DUF1015 domain-containing protein [Methanobacteriota archaeon]|nr:MAG: DUF1015 domain-containing protein [Euryarchaeota archaeon]
MVRVIPFNAVYYNNLRFGNDVGRFVAPPYDVVENRLEKKLKEDRLNITHLTLGDEDDGYGTVAKRLRRWLNDGVLVRDPEKSMYLYEQTFQGDDGVVRVRTGIVAAVRLEDAANGKILPHENIIPSHKEDRLALMSALRGDSEQIFMLYDDQTGEVERTIDECRKTEEVLRFIDSSGVHHRIVRIGESDTISRIQGFLEKQTALIADGHHRYETAIEYRNRSAKGHADEDGRPHDYILATLVSFVNPGLVINPAHRLVREVGPGELSALRDRLPLEFRIADFGSAGELEAALRDAPETAFGIWCPSLELIALAEPKEITGDGPLDALSVYVLQERVLKGMLGFTTEQLDKKVNIDYVVDFPSAWRTVESGEQAMCLFVKPPTVAQVMAVAKAGLKMPHKSTHFYPKIWSGTVLYLFDEQRPSEQ